MGDIYAKLIMLGKKTIDTVPHQLKDEVERRLKELMGEDDKII